MIGDRDIGGGNVLFILDWWSEYVRLYVFWFGHLSWLVHAMRTNGLFMCLCIWVDPILFVVLFLLLHH